MLEEKFLCLGSDTLMDRTSTSMYCVLDENARTSDPNESVSKHLVYNKRQRPV